MSSQLKYFKEFLYNKNNFHRVSNQQLLEVFCNYKIFSEEEMNDDKFFSDKIKGNIKESKVTVVNNYEEQNSGTKSLFFIFSFKNILLIISKEKLSNFVEQIQKINSKIEFSFIPFTNMQDIFKENVKCEYKKVENLFHDENLFQKELNSFNEQIKINKYPEIKDIILTCISGYFIEQSYSKTKYNRIFEYYNNQNQNQLIDLKFDEKDYIELRELGVGYACSAYLIYHIKSEQFFVIKKPNGLNNDEKEKLYKREKNNYEYIKNPHIPKYYGKTQKGYLVIEFINGKTLKDINKIKLSVSDIFKMIIELMITIEYLHNNKFIYRDLRPDNVMFDENKNIVLIDYDRMIKFMKNVEDIDNTIDLGSEFVAPEAKGGKSTYASDIYSIGKITSFMIKSDVNNMISTNYPDVYKKLCLSVEICINEDLNQRPSIADALIFFL